MNTILFNYIEYVNTYITVINGNGCGSMENNKGNGYGDGDFNGGYNGNGYGYGIMNILYVNNYGNRECIIL